MTDSSEVEETLIDVKQSHYIAKEESTFYIDNLIPNTIYTFNLSAKFIDGLWGPPYPLRLETSVEGGSSKKYK